MDATSTLEELAPEGGLLAVDSFSFLTLGLEPHGLARLLRGLHSACRARRSTAVLTTDRGMFDPRAEAIVIHLSDGFLQFHSRDGTDGVVRFLRIPKWTDGKFFDRNIYYEFDGRRIAIDLRSRVL
jgi:KaiC/GvpD/RAD55 family RecA-like ATPase